MWEMLPETKKQEYKRMILAFASLSEMFAQKAESDEETIRLSPIINSKYQETVFQRVFNASAEDIGNTSYDVAVINIDSNGNETKFLIGIKTFGISSGSQKVAQFKANHTEWSAIINQMRENARLSDGSKESINAVNKELYLELARKIANLRNARIKSSESNLQGFTIDNENDNVQAIYHVLMPSRKGVPPKIYVGETDYAQIDVENIKVIGCTGSAHPTNFDFTDGNHTYRYTAADSQLLMDFKNSEIVKEMWDVVYADDAYALFANLADSIYGKTKDVADNDNKGKVIESYSWMITNNNGEVERFSGFNSFYGVGSKLTLEGRKNRIEKIKEDFHNIIENEVLMAVTKKLSYFLLNRSSNRETRLEKELIRNEIVSLVHSTNNDDFISDVIKLVYRPKNEMYIPIPDARAFHENNPDFFGTNIGTFIDDTPELALEKGEREFNLIFEPSGDKIRAFITQDNGKAIESVEKQSYLGEWILRRIFQLPELEPLTAKRLNEIGINGIRLYKTDLNNDIHLQFIWIEQDSLPKDYVGD